jgi:DNA-binding transcriptional MerR regulator
MHLNDHFLDQWEHIINTVNKTDVPIECIKKVVIKLDKGRQKTINIHTLIKQGLELDEIERMLSRYFADNDNIIKDVDFVVDIKSVAHMIQPETDKLLGKL